MVSPSARVLWGGGIAVLVIGTALVVGLGYSRSQSSLGGSQIAYDKSAPSGAFGFAAEGRQDLDDEAARRGPATALAPIPTAAAAGGAGVPSDRLIVKTGTLTITVEDVPATIQAIGQYAAEHNGFIVMSQLYKNGLAPSGQITVRIPSDVFDAGVGDIKRLGEVADERVDGQDVTEEFVDLEARLKNLRSTEEQVLAIMKQAAKIQDILDVQRELGSVRGQIEQIEGRMKYLRESARLSTLTVFLSTDPSALPVINDDDRWQPWAEAKAAARSLLDVGRALVTGLIRVIVFVPVWGGAILVIWLVYRLVRRRQRAG